MTYVELTEKINKEVAGCFAYTNGSRIEVTFRGKKSNQIIIENGKVYNPSWQSANAARQIAEIAGLELA